MNAFWLSLSERDRLFLSAGGVFCGVLLFYALIYSPLLNAVDVKSRLWIEKKETLAWMREQANTKHTPKRADIHLLSVFSSQLKNTSFAHFPYQLQQTGEEHVQLSFDEVPYVDFLTWFKRLSEEYTFSLTELSVSRGVTPGVVKLRVIVSNSKGHKS